MYTMYPGLKLLVLIVVKRTFYCSDSKITEYEKMDTTPTPAVYVIIYRLIAAWDLDQNMEGGSLVTPILSVLLEAGRGRSAGSCRLDDLFPPVDLRSGSEIHCKFIYIFRTMDASNLIRLSITVTS